jgi:hypothetical protein
VSAKLDTGAVVTRAQLSAVVDVLERAVAQALDGHSTPSAAPGAALADQVFEAVRGYVDRRLTEQRFLHWAGPHTAGNVYSSGALVQKGSGLFVCLLKTAEAPGSSDHWRRIAHE